MKLMTPKQMQKVDQEAIAQYHIPGILLMEHAAYGMFSFIRMHPALKNIIIVCGSGNNGGDGFALARQIKAWSLQSVSILAFAEPEQLSEDGRIFYDICCAMQIEMIKIGTENVQLAYKELEEADLIVDALFGTGLSRKVEGIYADIITHINQSPAYTISVDIPSGIDGETGKILGTCVKADKTFTFVLPKTGMYRYPAIDYIGELEMIDIGIPKQIIDSARTSIFITEKEEMRRLLPKRPTRSNKGTYGKVLVIGGQTGMSGAVTLTSTAALKAGAGIVTAAVPKGIHDIMEQKVTEVMTVPLEEEDGHIAEAADKKIKELLSQYDVVAIGPGIGRSKDILTILLSILSSEKPCVIDADALFSLREMLEYVKVRTGSTVITPHPGEMARLTGLNAEYILENALEVTKQFAVENHVTIVLKIERTIVGGKEGTIYINQNGNTGLAKGGSGDLLTGIIAGLLAQNMAPADAARLGVYLHGRAADIMKSLKSEYAMLPSDLFDGLDQAFNEMINN